MPKPEPLPKNALRLDHHQDPVCIDHFKRPIGRVTSTVHADGDTLEEAVANLVRSLPAELYQALTAAMDAVDR